MTVATGAEDNERVGAYRRAAQMVVRAHDEELRNRFLALVDLARAARAEPDPLVRAWSGRAVWEVSKAFLGEEYEEHAFPPASFEAVQRSLRTRGYAACPTCGSTIASDRDLDRWRRMREALVAELRRREGAAP